LRIFENRVLRKTLGSTGQEKTGGWIKLCNEKFRGFHFSPWLTISRRIKLEVHLAVVGKKRNAYRLRPGNLNERDLLENTGIVVRTILKWVLKKQVIGRGLNYCG
jgi:hypothetical protein